MKPTALLSAFSFALASLLTPFAQAVEHRVSSLSEFQTRLAHVAPGDVLVLTRGVYETTEPLIVNRAGTADEPVRIVAEQTGAVTLTGSHGFRIEAPAEHVSIEGFVFAHASGRTVIAAGTRHVRFTRNTFRCVGDGPYLTVTGDDVRLDRNAFRDKATAGNMINVTGVDSQVARRLWIHHNHFHDFTPTGINGSETIRLGLSGLSMSMGHAIVEHNLFERCRGENELISNKSGGNTYRYNTFLDSAGTQLTLRHGNECLVYGNVFRGTAGLRLFGDRHRIFGNIFEGNTLGLNLGNGGAEVADGAPLTSHDRPDDNVLVFNVLVDNEVHYRMTRRTPNALGAINTMFAFNVLVGGGTASRIEGPNKGAVWKGNMVWQVDARGDLPEAGATQSDPGLTRDAQGLPRLPTGGALAQTAALAYPFIGDVDAGQIRVLTPADVGPASRE
jgi:poly(beta-D-mannuronate) lyase